MKKYNLYVVFLFYVFAVLNPSSAWAGRTDERVAVPDTNSLVVRTRQGLVRGAVSNNIYVWKGIRYAKAPVGDLRFRAPQPVDEWTGIKEATAFGPVASQPKSSFLNGEQIGEDCLSLNIWSPSPDGKKRPTMVWIHGGGFEIGSGSSHLYDGRSLAANGDVVVVTINYRLGILGFLYFGDHQPAFENNLGIRDQIAALQWVKQNIAAFGGDPNNVTIFGESAGGTSVETLLTCPAAKGLFQKVIAESGPPAILWKPATADSVRRELMSLLNLPADSIQLLKNIPIEKLITADKELSKYLIKETTNKVYSPTIDGRLITGDMFSGISSEQTGHVALMIGTNHDESTMFATHRLQMMPSDQKGLDKELWPRFSTTDKNKIIAAYPNYPKKRAVLNILTDAVFRMPAIRFAEMQSHFAPTYMYRFDWSPFLLNLTGMRTFHGLELPFVFGNITGKGSRPLQMLGRKKVISRISHKMQQAWVNFARFGNPNGASGDTWPSYNTESRATMIFNKESKVVNDPDTQQRQAWQGVKYY